MLKFWPAELIHSIFGLDSERSSWLGESERSEFLSPTQRDSLLKVLAELEDHCEKYQLKVPLHRCLELRVELESAKDDPNNSYFLANMEHVSKSCDAIKVQMILALQEKQFVFIPPDKVEFFEREALFGESVNRAFPSALSGIKDAGNCLAADLNDAAAFHLMCVTNIALIALARHMRVIIKRTPLEYAEWQTMIDKLEKKLKQKTVRPPGNKKSQAEARKFYHNALADIKFLKELRNEVMHARGSYTPLSARNLFEKVKSFMQQMAAHISE